MRFLKTIFYVCLIFLPFLSCNAKNDTASKNTIEDAGEVHQNIATVEEKWELPSALKEVSGIAYLDDQRFACVQDEDGIIFIFNTTTSKIEKEVKFAGGGDYEGLALVDQDAYVVRSDGKIFEVQAWQGSNPKTSEYSTALTEDHNIEGLCHDPANNRLLLAIKDEEPGNKDYKGIYGFDLASKQLAEEPVYKINLTDKAFDKIDEEDQEDLISPSEINIHPKTGEIYIIEGKDPKILILDTNGKIKLLEELDEKDFPQAEGLTFSPEGALFISNEGGKKAGNILRVSLNLSEN